MKKKLVIALKSDLCVASGYSYAGIVDSDICYDKYGLPYIPGRRLKGCFRDTAEHVLYDFVGEDQVKALFGVDGANKGGNLRISNARIKNYAEIREEIKALKRDSEIGSLFTQQRVLGQYTHIVAQTAIGEDDAAENKSLRYTRAINHYVPSGNGTEYSEMVFEAIVEYDDRNDVTDNNEVSNDRTTVEYDDRNDVTANLKLIVGATKNIGLKRNRGFGAVACRIEDINSMEDVEVVNVCCNEEQESFKQGGQYVITYTLTNTEPLMLSQLSDTHSEKHISGQMILGHLAGRYLKEGGHSSETDEFKDLFLNGTTKYVNAYPATIVNENDEGNLHIYYPAPLNINKLKKTKDYVDTLYSIPPEKLQPGNQPKKLKGKYVYTALSNNRTVIDIREVDMKLHYHHRGGDDSILYSSEAIEPDQVFAGEIYTDGKYVDLVRELINQDDFYFGKSKAAQYGQCKCNVYDIKPVDATDVETSEKEAEVDLKTDNSKGKARILVTLLTDAIFECEGEYTVKADDILKQLCGEIKGASAIEGGDDKEPLIMMETGLVSGYQTMWNMHKPLYPIVKAGSCLILDSSEYKDIPNRIWVGTKNQEGYGYASVIPMKERMLSLYEIKDEENTANTKIDIFAPQFSNILKKQLLDELIGNQFKLTGVSKTQISRAIMMVKQSNDFSDFKKRVNSIKTDSVRNKFKDALINPIDGGNTAAIHKLIEEGSKAKQYYDRLTDADISELWKEYLEYNLTLCKYEAKEA